MLIVKCPICGKEKKTYPYYLRTSKSGFVFCSSHCFGIFNNRERKRTGYHYSKEQLLIRSKSLRIACSNNKNPIWKGDKVGKVALHQWINIRKPKPDFCEECRTKPPKDLANISGKYKRDISDYRWLCRKCHELLDGHIKNLKQYANGYYEEE